MSRIQLAINVSDLDAAVGFYSKLFLGDIHGKWRGTRYRFIQRYRSGFPETLNEEFDNPFVALDWVSRDRFDIQWYRHTGAWHCLYHDLSLTEALNAIETDPVLHPL